MINMRRKKSGDDEDKGFEAKIKTMYSGGGCSCQTGLLEKKKSSLKELVCRNCGKTYKTNLDTEYCFRCRKKIKGD